MRSDRQHPGRVFINRYGLMQVDEHVLRYADFLREEAGLDDTPPIDLARIRNHFGLPSPIRAASQRNAAIGASSMATTQRTASCLQVMTPSTRNWSATVGRCTNGLLVVS